MRRRGAMILGSGRQQVCRGPATSIGLSFTRSRGMRIGQPVLRQCSIKALILGLRLDVSQSHGSNLHSCHPRDEICISCFLPIRFSELTPGKIEVPFTAARLVFLSDTITDSQTLKKMQSSVWVKRQCCCEICHRRSRYKTIPSIARP